MKRKNSKKDKKNWEYVGATLLLYGFISAIVLAQFPNMMFVVGNPKPVYFYDIHSSCNANNIENAINDFSRKTDVKFIKLSHPYALWIGGLSYRCNYTYESMYLGTSGSGVGGFWFIIFAWNSIMLHTDDYDVVIHETMHSMGFDHDSEENSIMNAFASDTDAEIPFEKIKQMYSHNVFAYFNIIPLNLLYFLFVVLPFVILFIYLIIKKINSKF